jgi:hypothetical protein
MRSLRGVLAVLAVLAGLGSGLAPVGAAEFETPGTPSAAAVLPANLATGPHHKIRSVLADGYMYHFTVESKMGTFQATGIGALRKLVHELAAIAKLREIKAGKAFAAAVKDSATGPFRFAKNLITHPVDTVSGVPKGAYKMMEEAATAVTTERDASDDPAYKKLLLVSGNKRTYAGQLGVDVYSSNQVLQKELNSVGWAAAVGNLTVSAALMPVGGAAGAALTGVRWSNALNDMLTKEPAPRLRIINEGQLSAMGIPPDLTKRFLDHQTFSPRHKTILVDCLAALGNARGREKFLEAALVADEEAEANFFTNAAQILRGYHETVSPIVEIQRDVRLAVARASNGDAFIPLPLDYVMWTNGADKRSGEVKAASAAAGSQGKFEVWLTGKVSPRAQQELQGRGFAVAEEVGKRILIME